MPTVFSHSLVAITFGKIFSKGNGTKFWILSVICAILPDFDVFLRNFGVPYGHMFGHRGIMHSILFVLTAALIVVFLGFRDIKRFSKGWWLFVLYFFLIGLSHIILDAMTTGGFGVGFFLPFDSTRYFFPVRPIRVSPFSLMRLFEGEGKRIIISELFWIWIPSAAVLIILKYFKNKKMVINK